MKVRVRGLKHFTRQYKGKTYTYIYHRATGERIKESVGSPEFLKHIDQLNDRPALAMAGKRGTLGGLVAVYKRSPEFRLLAPRTQADYDKVFDWLKPLDAAPLHKFTPAEVIKLRDHAFKARKRAFANYVLAVLSILWNWGEPRGLTEGNPTGNVRKIRRGRDERNVNRAWTDQEIEIVLGEAPPELRLPIIIGAFTGLREADVLRLPWAAYDGEAITWRQGKTGDEVWIPTHSTLKRALDDAPRRSPVIVVGKRGAPFTGNGFRARWGKLRNRLAEEGKIGPGLTFHGLRHTVGKRLADAGCDAATIKAITGHRTTQMVERYTREADTKARAKAAILRLERNIRATVLSKKTD